MKNGVLRRTQVAVVALAAMVLLACGTMANAEDVKQDDAWHFAVIPYLWLPSVNGSLNIVRPNSPISGNVDIGSSDYLGNLTFAAMLTMEARKGNWSVLSDLMYVDFSDDNRQATVPGRLGEAFNVRAETGLKALVFEIAGAYSAYRSESAEIYFLGGLRYAGIKTTLSLDIAPALPVDILSPNLSDKKDLFDPIIGVKGKIGLGKKWFLPYYFDIGGFGINNDFTWQAFAGVGYRFSDLFSMVLAYRHLQYTFHDNELLNDFYLSGAELGFVFQF